jgi:autotransporter-associated beta strand protein
VRSPSPWSILLGTLLALLAAALNPAPALAAQKMWSGLGADANWSTPANWVGGVAPVDGDDLVFPAGASQLTNTNDFLPFPLPVSINSITIQGSGYTLDGFSVRMPLFGTISAAYPTGTTSTINLSIAAAGSTINVANPGATLVFGGQLTSQSNYTKAGPGTAVLLATGTAPSGWSVGAGILNVQNGAALGNERVFVGAGGTLQLQGGIALPNRIDFGGAVTATGAVESVTGSNTLTGPIFLNNGNPTMSVDAGSTLTVSTNPVNLNTFTLAVDVAGAATFTSPIQGTGGLTKAGAGVLTLSGTNTYTGPTTVSAGTLLVNGSQSSSSGSVASGATLGGTGTIGAVTVNGTLSPGVGGPGVLHTGNATFNGSATFAVDLDGTTVGSGYDQLFATGTVTLSGPTLAVSVGFPSAPGNMFAIIQSTGAISGGFSGLPDGFTFTSGGRTFRINYTANAVTLTDVTPAPTATPTATTCILGDINCDGIVDIRDYGIWRQNFGQTNCGNPADLDGNCIVDIRDYGVWRANFGHTSGPAARTVTPVVAPRLGVATPTPIAGRAPASGERGSARGVIRQAAQAPGLAFPNEILLQIAALIQ